MGHTKGPIVSQDGFKVGSYESNTEVINSSAKVLTTALQDEAGAAQSITAVSSTGAYSVGNLVSIVGLSTVSGYTSNYKVALAKNNDTALPAHFVVTSASTAAAKPCTVSGVATLSVNSTQAKNTALYLSTVGTVTHTKPTLKANIAQKLAMVVTQSSVAGVIRYYPAYSHAICQSS